MNQMLLIKLAMLLALAAEAAGSAASSLPEAQHPPAETATPRVGLFFSANVSAACAGRCSLRATTAAPCGRGNGSASAPALLEPWNSLLLAGGWQQQGLEIYMHTECSDPGCSPVPASFLLWRSDGNASSACTQRSKPASVPPEPRLLPGFTGNGDAFYTLNSKEPLVAVFYEPSAAAAPAAVREDLHACKSQLPTAAACQASGGTTAASEPAVEATAAATEQDAECRAQHLLVLRLALSAWVLACTSAGALL